MKKISSLDEKFSKEIGILKKAEILELKNSICQIRQKALSIY
jgi:hypothetical protein